MSSLFLFVNTLNLDQSTPNSFYPKYQSVLSHTLLRFCGTNFVETLYAIYLLNFVHLYIKLGTGGYIRYLPAPMYHLPYIGGKFTTVISV